MAYDNDFFMNMCNEAMKELASGKGWKEADTNTLVLACFGMIFNHLSKRILRPLWFVAGSFSAGVVGYIVKLILG